MKHNMYCGNEVENVCGEPPVQTDEQYHSTPYLQLHAVNWLYWSIGSTIGSQFTQDRPIHRSRIESTRLYM